MFKAFFSVLELRNLTATAVLLLAVFAMSSCQEKKKTGTGSEGVTAYEHPSTSTSSGGTTTTSGVKTTTAALSLTQDVVLQIGTSKVTIPAGAVRAEGTAVLKSYVGTIVNSLVVKMVTESLILVLTKTDGSEFTLPEIYKDIVIEQTTTAKTTKTKLVGFFVENAQKSPEFKYGRIYSQLLDSIVDLGGGVFKVTQKVRPGRLGFVFAETANGTLPLGYGSFIAPPKDPSVVSGTASTPADVTINWSGDPRFNAGYGLVYWTADEDEVDCTYSDSITPTVVDSLIPSTTSTDYTLDVTDLEDGEDYTFRVCGLSSRSPADSSGGTDVVVSTPARATAILTNSPTDPSKDTVLNITVSGTSVTHYKYGVATNAADCSAVTYSDWIEVSTLITDSVPQVTDDTVKVCVLAKISETNIQLDPTVAAWTVDKTPPVFTTLDLAAPALDGYLSSADRVLSTDIGGTLTATDHDPSLTNYLVVSSATTCDGLLTYQSAVPKANAAEIAVDGTYKICVKISDAAGNLAYGSSSNFVVDTLISFTSLSLINDAADSYLNLLESGAASAVVSAAVGVGFSSANYVVAPWATTCDGALAYVAIPTNNDAGFTADGDYKVCARLSDLAGNIAYGGSNVIHRKTALPSFTSMSLANSVVDTYLSAADRLLTSALATTATASDYDTIEYAVTLNATSCNAVGSWAPSVPQADDAGIVSDGSAYKVCAKVTDLAGNPASYGNTAAFTFDQTPPVFTSLALQNGATDNYLNGTEIAAALDVHATVVGSGFTSEAYSLTSSATTCNGLLTYGASVIKANDAGFVPGSTYKICAKLEDVAGNLTYGASSNLQVIVSTPDCTSLPLANNAVDLWINVADSSSALALTAAASTTLGTPVKTYGLISSVAACDGSVSFGAQDVIPASNDVGLVNGSTFKVCAKVTDAAGNTPAYCASTPFDVDTTPPIFTSLPLDGTAIDGYVNISEHTLNTAVAGALTASGHTSAGFVAVADATTCNILLTYSGTVPAADDAVLNASGTYKVCVQLLDAAGNATYDQTASFISDQIAPVFTSLALANEANGGYINLAESVSGLDAADTLVAAGQNTTEYSVQTAAGACSAVVFGGSVPTIAGVGGLGDGSYKVCTKLTDSSGNLTYGATSTVVVDVTAPSFTSAALTGVAADTYINFSEHSLTSALVSAATGTGHDSTTYALVADGTACSGVAVWSGSISNSDSGDFGVDGDYIVCVKLADFAGNPNSFGSSSVIHLKTDFPVFTSLDLVNDASDSYLNANEHTLTNALGGNLTGSGYSSATYSLAAFATACDGGLTYGAMPLSNDAGLSSAGQFKICVALTDVAANVTYGATSGFEYDPTAPVFTSLALANDVTDNWLNATEHAGSNALGGAVVGSGYTSHDYAVVTSGTTCNVSVTYGAMPASNDAGVTDGGTWKLCVRLTDASGNMTYGTGTGTFESDFNVPSFTSVALAGTSADGFINLSDSSGATDVVSTAVGADHSSAAYVAVTSGTTCDGLLTYGSIPKTNDGGFSGDGTYKVCVKLTDTAGNTPAYGASANVVRDITAPSSTLTTSGSITPSTTPGSNTQLSGTATDVTSGVASVSLSIQEGAGGCYNSVSNDFSSACPNWVTATGTTAWTYDIPDDGLLKGATYTVQVRGTDLALTGGNVQTAFGSGTFSFTASEGQDLWNDAVVYDAGGSDRPLASAIDSSGNLFVVGWHTLVDKNWLIKKFDPRGNEDTTNWNKDVGDAGADEIARGIAFDSSNNVYVVGSRHNGSNLDWWLKKYNSSGAEDLINWDIILDGNSGNDEAMAVAVDSSDNVIVVGYGSNIAGGGTGEDIWIRKYSSAGILGCEQEIDGGGPNLADRGIGLVVNGATGKAYFTGFQTESGGDQQMVVRRMKISDCSMEVTQLANSAGTADDGSSISLDSSGNVYVVGKNSSTDSDWWIRKYSSALVFQSEFNTGVAGSHEAKAVGIDAANNIYVGGYKTGATSDWWLRQFNTSLTEDAANWDKVIDANASSDQISSISIGTGANDIGSVYVIGWGTNISNGGSSEDWWIKKYSGP